MIKTIRGKRLAVDIEGNGDPVLMISRPWRHNQRLGCPSEGAGTEVYDNSSRSGGVWSVTPRGDSVDRELG